MFTKLNSSLETRNILGIAEEDLEKLALDPYYEYLQVPSLEPLVAEKAGQLIELELVPLNVKLHRGVTIEPNPMLHEFGSVSYSAIIGSGTQVPKLTIRAYGKGEVSLDWVARLRLLG